MLGLPGWPGGRRILVSKRPINKQTESGDPNEQFGHLGNVWEWEAQWVLIPALGFYSFLSC